MSQVLDLLKRLVKYDTRTNKDSPGKEILDLLVNEIEKPLIKYGFNVEYFQSNGHHSLLAIRKGKAPLILFSGHVDVVPWDERWETNPQEMVIKTESGEEIVIGRGVSDMKSGIAALMTALPELCRTNLGLLFAITGDEEIGGEDGTGIIVDYLISEGLLPDYVITADAAGMEIITRRRNAFDIFIKSKKSRRKVLGKKIELIFESNIISSPTSHAAYFKKDKDKHALKLMTECMITNNLLPTSVTGSFVKVNVIPNEIRAEFVQLDEMGEELIVDDGLHHILIFADKVMDIDFETQADSDYGINSTVNVIEGKGEFWILQADIRAMIDKDASELDGSLLLIFDEINWEFDFEILKSVGFTATPNDSPLVLAASNILNDLGYNPQSSERGGATDGRFFAQHNIQTIDIGAIGWNVHGANETATIKSIEDLVKFFERVPQEIANYHRE